MNLPSYAYAERSVHADGDRDLLASFRDDNGGTITVWIERGEAETFFFNITRSGLGEGRFTKKELGRVVEVATALFHGL